MKKLLLVLPALLFAACGDNLQPDLDQAVGGADGDGAAVPETPGPGDTLVVGFIYSPNDCADHSVYLQGHYAYPDGTQVEHPICRYQSADGTVLDDCVGPLSVPTLQNVVFTVTDADTGATGSTTSPVEGPKSFSVTLDANGFNFGSNQLGIGWYAQTKYGDQTDVGHVVMDISPTENLIIQDPEIFNTPIGPIGVTQPGTYTVSVTAWIIFGDEGGCTATDQKTVEVPACSSDPHSP